MESVPTPRMGRHKRHLLFAIGLSCAFAVQVARATVLAPGDSGIVPIDQIAEFSGSDFISTVDDTRLFSILIGPNHNIPYLSGKILDRVITLNNGTLVFETRVFVTDAPAGVGLNTAARGSFAGFSTDVSFVGDAPGNFMPGSAGRSPLTGSDVQFNFSDPNLITDTHLLAPQNQGSHTLVIATDATKFDLVGTFRVKVGTGASALLSDPIPVWAPVGVPVPEPTTWAVLLAGLGLLGVAARRKNRS